MTNGGQRIATATGAMLADPADLGNPLQSAAESRFQPEFWSARGELEAVSGGRGSAWFVGPPSEQWVLRHYRRGGFVANLSNDRYVWAGEGRVRSFVEWRLLEHLVKRGLPVPKPVAARYQRAALSYRCDLITQRIADTRSVSAVLKTGALPETTWHAIGAVIARLHRAGVDHADLNAHNILLDSNSSISIIDFDRGRLREPGAWSRRNLERLQRSLVKISAALPPERFSATAWACLLAGYRAA
jgi:3-deoxy-D-manno-octulosonic acid kinase